MHRSPCVVSSSELLTYPFSIYMYISRCLYLLSTDLLYRSLCISVFSCLSTYPFVFSTCLSIPQPICDSIFLPSLCHASAFSLSLSLCFFALFPPIIHHQSIHPPIYLSTFLASVQLSACASVHLPDLALSTFLTIHLSIHLSSHPHSVLSMNTSIYQPF